MSCGCCQQLRIVASVQARKAEGSKCGYQDDEGNLFTDRVDHYENGDCTWPSTFGFVDIADPDGCPADGSPDCGAVDPLGAFLSTDLTGPVTIEDACSLLAGFDLVDDGDPFDVEICNVEAGSFAALQDTFHPIGATPSTIIIPAAGSPETTPGTGRRTALRMVLRRTDYPVPVRIEIDEITRDAETLVVAGVSTRTVDLTDVDESDALDVDSPGCGQEKLLGFRVFAPVFGP